MADVTVKNFNLRVATVYEPNIASVRVSFFQQSVLFLEDLKQIALVSDWNAILDPEIDRVGDEIEGREGVKAAWSI